METTDVTDVFSWLPCLIRWWLCAQGVNLYLEKHVFFTEKNGKLLVLCNSLQFQGCGIYPLDADSMPPEIPHQPGKTWTRASRNRGTVCKCRGKVVEQNKFLHLQNILLTSGHVVLSKDFSSLRYSFTAFLARQCLGALQWEHVKKNMWWW